MNILVDILFVSLVFADGFLTRSLLAMGAVEANPNPFVLWSVEHLWVRILVAVVIVALLRFLGKGHLVGWLCFACLCICIWNTLIMVVGDFLIMSVAVFD